jgi:hypothetical protein
MKTIYFKFIIFAFFFTSCAPIPLPKHPSVSEWKAITLKNDDTLIGRFAPVFVIEDFKETYNLIGTPSAVISKDHEEKIFVDSSCATIYTEIREFITSQGSYKNLIYRIHFEKIPLGIIPFHIGAGANVGVVVVITLNSRDEPLLYTTLHTCGCYLAFIPTSYMPENGFPNGWKRERKNVYGENLPGFLQYKTPSHDKLKTMILMRSGSHRVKDIWLSSLNSIQQYNIISARRQPLGSLEQISISDGQTTSFYETSGPRAGYVKYSHKIWERLLMSWWAFDWRIGEDKKLGTNKNDSIVFYTSLKPWDRKKSDMRDFEAFLKYWKWRL